MRFQDMPYQRIAYEEIEADYQALFRDVQAASCEADCLAALKKHDRLCDRMTPIDLCYVRHGMDVNDPFYAGEQTYYDEIGPKISALQQQFHRLLVESPFAGFFEKTLGSFAFSILQSSLLSEDERLIPLEQEENALLNRYHQLTANAKAVYRGQEVRLGSLTRDQQSADRAVRQSAYEAAVACWEGLREELEDIFDRLVDNRDRQARMLGYPGFVALSYRRMNRIGYGPEEVRAFREQVKTCLVPLAAELNERRRKRLGLDKLYPYDGGVYFPQGNPTPMGGESFCLEMTRKMYGDLSPETKEYIDDLLDNGLYDVAMREGKQSGGYCTELGAYRVPFIFANFDGTSENAYIMTHEGGHGFYFYLKRNEEIRERGWYTPEMAETHAMSMECFTSPFMELFFGSRAGDYRAMYLEKAVSLILYQCQQDEFQQIIYDQPGLTRQQRNDVWARLEKDYFPFREYPGEERRRAGTRWQRIPHVFLWPFYAIDYALAQVCALQYLRRMNEQPGEAWNSYMTFLRASGNQNFPEALQTAGLESPFAPGSLEKLMNWLRTQLSMTRSTPIPGRCSPRYRCRILTMKSSASAWSMYPPSRAAVPASRACCGRSRPGTLSAAPRQSGRAISRGRASDELEKAVDHLCRPVRCGRRGGAHCAQPWDRSGNGWVGCAPDEREQRLLRRGGPLYRLQRAGIHSGGGQFLRHSVPVPHDGAAVFPQKKQPRGKKNLLHLLPGEEGAPGGGGKVADQVGHAPGGAGLPAPVRRLCGTVLPAEIGREAGWAVPDGRDERQPALVAPICSTSRACVSVHAPG